MRSFDPRSVGALECRAWETYYRRKWGAFLIASVALVRAAFRMSWPRTLYGAWLVLRANLLWAPVPDNDPDGARRTMARFYRLLDADIDAMRAAALRAEAMDVSDRWIEAGCDPGSPMLAQERALLVRSYAARLGAVYR